ncbi:MAG: hypothetical protein EHM20_00060 [Alphaproteobacteria bacterium]|nr:MAG: hypothetical protein EHM20_12800 [Alphaproteobacteria bacterium]RPJ79817.1 MAG: hypothetical protein EHM20_00060 [Alphaproteobacteria bacterium]
MANQIDIILQIVTNTERKVDEISRNMVTKENCNDKRANCIYSKKFEWSLKKITILVGLIGAFFTGLVSLAKIL